MKGGKKAAGLSGAEHEIRWLVDHREPDVREVVRGFRRLTRGRRGELGATAGTLVSLLEIALKDKRKCTRAERAAKPKGRVRQ